MSARYVPTRKNNYSLLSDVKGTYMEIIRLTSTICAVLVAYVLKLRESLPQKMFNLALTFFFIFFGILLNFTNIFVSYLFGFSLKSTARKGKSKFFLFKYWKTLKDVNQASFVLISSLFFFSIALYISSDILGILMSSEAFTFQKFATLFTVCSIPVILYFTKLYNSFQTILPFLNIFIFIIFSISVYLATSISQQNVFSPVVNYFAIFSTIAMVFPACAFITHQIDVIQKAEKNKRKIFPVVVSVLISWAIFMLIGNVLYLFGGISDLLAAIVNVGRKNPSGVLYTVSKNSYLGFLIQLLIVVFIGINLLGSFDVIMAEIKVGVKELGRYLYDEYYIPVLIISFTLTSLSYLYYIWLTEGTFQMSYVFLTKFFVPVIIIGVPFLVGFTGLFTAWGIITFIAFFVLMFIGLLCFAGYLSYTGYFSQIVFSFFGFLFQLILFPLKLIFGGLVTVVAE